MLKDEWRGLNSLSIPRWLAPCFEELMFHRGNIDRFFLLTLMCWNRGKKTPICCNIIIRKTNPIIRERLTMPRRDECSPFENKISFVLMMINFPLSIIYMTYYELSSTFYLSTLIFSSFSLIFHTCLVQKQFSLQWWSWNQMAVTVWYGEWAKLSRRKQFFFTCSYASFGVQEFLVKHEVWAVFQYAYL